MKKKTVSLFLVICMSIIVFAGCSVGNTEESKVNEIQDENKNKAGDTTDIPEKEAGNTGTSADSLFDSADLQGTVTEFSDTGCIITKQIEDKEEGIIYEAAPGNENDDEKVTVLYGEDMVFQTAVVNYSTEELESLEDTRQSELKKQSSILLYGSFQDSSTFQAKKIIIIHQSERR